MCPRKAPPNPDRSALVAVERLPNMTVLRFHGQDALAGVDLRLLNGLWEFWEAEHLEPSPVVVVIAPSELLSPRSLERLLGGPSVTNGASAAEVSERIVGEGNVTRQFVEHVRRLDSFVVGVVGGEVTFRQAAPLLACDYRIIGSDTVFVNMTQDLPWAPLNCLPWLLAKMVGGAKASQLLLDVPRLSAADAHDLGLVNHITSPDRLESEAFEVAERLASLPRATLVSLKRAIIASSEDFQAYQHQEITLTDQLASAYWKENIGGTP